MFQVYGVGVSFQAFLLLLFESCYFKNHIDILTVLFDSFKIFILTTYFFVSD